MTVMLIRRVAKDLAGADYEEDHSPRFRKLWPDVKTFIGRAWPMYVEAARAVLTSMLNRKDVPQSQKDEIADALIEDNNRAIHQPTTKVGVGPLMLNPDHPGALERKLFH